MNDIALIRLIQVRQKVFYDPSYTSMYCLAVSMVILKLEKYRVVASSNARC